MARPGAPSCSCGIGQRSRRTRRGRASPRRQSRRWRRWRRRRPRPELDRSAEALLLKRAGARADTYLNGDSMHKCLPVLLALSSAALAQEPAGASSNQIAVGMSGALTGPARALGLGMRAGIDAYFARTNRSGGVFGKQLRLIALDDGYEPLLAAGNLHRLIDQEKVFAVLGDPGTPTAAIGVPIA